jgi:hypothetical protein
MKESYHSCELTIQPPRVVTSITTGWHARDEIFGEADTLGTRLGSMGAATSQGLVKGRPAADRRTMTVQEMKGAGRG